MESFERRVTCMVEQKDWAKLLRGYTDMGNYQVCTSTSSGCFRNSEEADIIMVVGDLLGRDEMHGEEEHRDEWWGDGRC